MPRAIFEWSGVEYERSPKNADWYWAMGIIATAATLACILFGNLLLAVLIVIAAVTIAVHAAKHSPVHNFALTDQGVVIGDALHPFENIRSFSVFEYIEGDKPPMLSIKTDSWLFPHLLIPLSEVDVDGVYAHLLKHVDEIEHHHSL